jgi:hypothetical protein
MIGHLDTKEFHNNENDFLYKSDRERMQWVVPKAYGNMLEAIKLNGNENMVCLWR